jgi:hypothetical protein
MPEMTNRIAGLGLSLLQPLVDRHAGAKDRSGWFEVQAVRQVAHIVRISEGVLREAAIDGIARVLLRIAQCFPGGEAMPAMTARRVEPGYADPIAFLHCGYARAHGGNGPNAFMTGNEGGIRLDRPVAICGMQVRMTDAARFDLHEDLASSNLRDWHLLY